MKYWQSSCCSSPPHTPPSHIRRMISSRPSPSPLLLCHQVSPPASHLPCRRTKVTKPCRQACCLDFHKQGREIPAILAQDHTPPPICHWLATLSGQEKYSRLDKCSDDSSQVRCCIHDACIHDTYIHAPWSWCNHWHMFDAYILYPDTRGHDTHIYDAWRVTRAFIHDLDTCMYDACIFGLRSLTLIHVCVMHTSIIRDPDTCVYDACIHDAAYLSSMDKPWLWCIYTWCMYARCIYIYSLIIMHMCMMH